MRVRLRTLQEDGSFKERIVKVKLIKSFKKTVLVELPDGNVIKRHKDKHVVSASEGESETCQGH